MDVRGWYSSNSHGLRFATQDLETGEDAYVQVPLNIVEKIWLATKNESTPELKEKIAKLESELNGLKLANALLKQRQ